MLDIIFKLDMIVGCYQNNLTCQAAAFDIQDGSNCHKYPIHDSMNSYRSKDANFSFWLQMIEFKM